MHARPRFPAIALRRLAALAALALPLSATAANPSSCDFSVLDAPMQSLMEQAGLTGAAVLVGRRDGVLYERYYGGYSATTVVPIASATKLLSAARITQLAARRALRSMTWPRCSVTFSRRCTRTSGMSMATGQTS